MDSWCMSVNRRVHIKKLQAAMLSCQALISGAISEDMALQAMGYNNPSAKMESFISMMTISAAMFVMQEPIK